VVSACIASNPAAVSAEPTVVCLEGLRRRRPSHRRRLRNRIGARRLRSAVLFWAWDVADKRASRAPAAMWNRTDLDERFMAVAFCGGCGGCGGQTKIRRKPEIRLERSRGNGTRTCGGFRGFRMVPENRLQCSVPRKGQPPNTFSVRLKNQWVNAPGGGFEKIGYSSPCGRVKAKMWILEKKHYLPRQPARYNGRSIDRFSGNIHLTARPHSTSKRYQFRSK
jgi:hypothetical protein